MSVLIDHKTMAKDCPNNRLVETKEYNGETHYACEPNFPKRIKKKWKLESRTWEVGSMRERWRRARHLPASSKHRPDLQM